MNCRSQLLAISVCSALALLPVQVASAQGVGSSGSLSVGSQAPVPSTPPDLPIPLPESHEDKMARETLDEINGIRADLALPLITEDPMQSSALKAFLEEIIHRSIFDPNPDEPILGPLNSGVAVVCTDVADFSPAAVAEALKISALAPGPEVVPDSVISIGGAKNIVDMDYTVAGIAFGENSSTEVACVVLASEVT